MAGVSDAGTLEGEASAEEREAAVRDVIQDDRADVVIAAIFPARRAARLNVLQALQYE